MKKYPINSVQGAYLFYFDRHCDGRGYFEEIVSSASEYPFKNLDNFQINLSYSRKGVIRGLHVAPFAKLCTCVRGSLYDVVVDVRKDSPTFMNWFGIWLCEYKTTQVYVPPGCAHGFFAAENDTVLVYFQDGNYNPKEEWSIYWKDPNLDILWPESEKYILSHKDQNAPFLQSVIS